MRYNWNPKEKCAAELDSYSSIQIRQRRTRCESQSKSAGAGRDGPNIRYCVPLKIPNIRYCVPTEIPENPQSNAVPAGPPPAGKTPNPTPTRPDRRRPGKPPIQRPGRTAAGPENPQTKSASVVLLLLLSSPHGKAGSAGKHVRKYERICRWSIGRE